MTASDPFSQAMINAQLLLNGKVVRTPILQSKSIARIAQKSMEKNGFSAPSMNVIFKCENLQTTGSFKFRGTMHFISKLSEPQLSAGVVTYSTGNHAMAVACATQLFSKAKDMEIACTVVMPTSTVDFKIRAARDFGANIVLHGSSVVDCQLLAQKLCEDSGATLIPPSGHPDIMIGQATVMRELADQVFEEHRSELDIVLVPSAGGGLLAGTGYACQGSTTLVIGVEPEDGGANLSKARKTGTLVRDINSDFTTIAEGLRSPTAEFNWEFLRDNVYVHDVFGATDEQIKIAMRIMIEELKLVVEPSAAVALAVLLFNKKCSQLLSERGHWNVGIVISGGNANIERIVQLLKDTH